jgi:hypothetical protein
MEQLNIPKKLTTLEQLTTGNTRCQVKIQSDLSVMVEMTNGLR